MDAVLYVLLPGGLLTSQGLPLLISKQAWLARYNNEQHGHQWMSI